MRQCRLLNKYSEGGQDMSKVLGDKKALALFTIPALLLFTILVFIPIIWSMVYTFFTGTPGVNFTFSGGANYLRIFQDAQLWTTFKNNIIYVITVGGGQIVFGFLIAMVINFGVREHQNLVRTLLFIPVVLPGVASAQLWLKMYAITPQYGLLNSIFNMLGIDSLVKAWTGDPSTAMIALIIMDIWKALGMYILIFYSGIIDLPEDAVEAARIDGANVFQIITRIQMPMLKPIFRMALVMCITACFKVYDSPVALTGGGPGIVTTMPSMYMYSNAFNYSQFGYASVIAILILIECAIFTVAVNKLLAQKD